MKRLVAILAGTAALCVLPAAAHHGWSSYDSDKPVTVSGTIVQADYSYPHATIRLEADGKTWLAVLAPPSRMSARGLASADLKAGARATVEGYPSRNDAAELRAERIILGGRTTELR
jgi:hypothetical protein